MPHNGIVLGGLSSPHIMSVAYLPDLSGTSNQSIQYSLLTLVLLHPRLHIEGYGYETRPSSLLYVFVRFLALTVHKTQ